MKPGYSITRPPFLFGTGFLLLIILAELSVVLLMNNGLLVYTLDDPYVHMALGENIMRGHYGININEFASPSSTILWPFLIAPFSSYACFSFYINVAAAVVTLYLFMKILYASFRFNDKRMSNTLIASFLILIIPAVNLVGLVFTGMEHSLQVLLVSLIAYGLIKEIEKNKVEYWLLAAIVAAPLIRYENLAVSIAAIVYLLLNKHFKNALSVSALLLIMVGGFSLFLLKLGLDPLPASVEIKSYIVQSGGSLHSILSGFKQTLTYRQGIIMLLGTASLLYYILLTKNIKKKKLALVTIIALFLHFIAGRYGWFNRYEIYIWTYFILIALYLSGSKITNLLEGEYRISNLILIITIAAGIVVIVSYNYITGLFELPLASNNVYEQQYQMHRFAVDYYNKPVAVNDLGYVSYKNNNYVLDLFGLASIGSFNDRKTRKSEWMQRLVSEKNVGLAMIYKEWFNNIPEKWVEIGELELGKMKITPAYGKVAFYATGRKYYPEITEKLRLFIKTLPDDVKFTFVKNDK